MFVLTIHVLTCFYIQALEESRNAPRKHRAGCEQINCSQQVNRLPSTCQHVNRSRGASCTQLTDELKVLKEPLTRENYVNKFHCLVNCEEREHEKILKEKYDLIHTVLF